MDRNDQRNSVILFRQNSAKVTVPRVAMHEIGIDIHCIEVGAPPHCAESGAQRLRASKIARVEFEADDLEIALLKTLVAKATHFHRHYLRQLTRQITHVHTSAAVNVRRILVSQKEDFHAPRVEQASGLLSTEFARRTLRYFIFLLSTITPAHPLRGGLYLQLRRRECR